MGVEIRKIDPRSELGRELYAGSSAEQIARYGRDGGKSIEALAKDDVVFVAALVDGEPAGCGAVVTIGPRLGELSRIYVRETARRRGVGKAILAWIEAHARANFDRLVLETGVAQPESIALYESCGYTAIPCWGASADNPKSRCYQKLVG